MPTTARKLAATLSEKKAELAAIDNVTLPRLHQAIGRRLARLANVPPSLAIHAERIRHLESSGTQTELSSGDTLGSAYATCGREAVAQYGAKAVPKEIAAEFEAVTKAREALVAEIAALESTTGSRAVTALRLVAAALVLVAMLGGFVFMRNGSALLGARTDGGAASDSGGSVTAPTGLANGSAGSSSPRSLANDDIADIQGIADRVTKTVAEQIKGLAKKEPASAIQKGCDAALREWRSSAAQLLAPIANTAAVKGLPAGLKAGVFKEALATLDEDYQREVTQAMDELARRVESTKEDVGGQFTFLLDNGKPFVVPADKRIPALEQICNRLADYFTDTTNRLARARADGVQAIAAAWEQAQSALASMANDLEAESQSAKQRLTRESKSLIDSVAATFSRVDGAATKAIETRLEAFKKEITAAMDAEVKAYDEYWAKRARDFSSLVQGGGNADALSEQQHEITTSLYSRVEGSLKVIREKCDAERQSLAALTGQSAIALADSSPEARPQRMTGGSSADDTDDQAGSVRPDTGAVPAVGTLFSPLKTATESAMRDAPQGRETRTDATRNGSLTPSWGQLESLNTLVEQSGVDFLTFLQFGTQEIAKKAKGDRFDRIEVNEDVGQHRRSLEAKTLLWTASKYRDVENIFRDETAAGKPLQWPSAKTDGRDDAADSATLEQTISVELPFRVADLQEGLGPDVSIWDGSMSYAYLTKDGQIRVMTHPQELRMVREGNGMIYLLDSKTSTLYIRLKGSLNAMKSLVREGDKHVVQVQLSRLQVGQPINWGYYSEEEMHSEQRHAPAIRLHESYRAEAVKKGTVEANSPPVYFITKTFPDTPYLSMAFIDRIEVARIDGTERQVLFSVEAKDWDKR